MATYQEILNLIGPGPENDGMAMLISGKLPSETVIGSPTVIYGTRNPLTAPTPIVWEMDNVGPWGVTIDVGHHQRHEGDSFGACYVNSDLGDTAQMNILIKTGTDYPHFLYHVTCPNAFTIQFFKDASATVDGTGLTIFNHNQNKSYTSDASAYHSPTIASTGTLLEQFYIGGGNQRSGGSSRSESEWILKSSTRYLLRVTSRAANNMGAIVLDWYEEGASA